MKRSNRPFYKGIPGFTREREDEYGLDAGRGIYGWWWRYLRLSPVFWYARTTGISPKTPQLAKVFAEAGDLSHDIFNRWWRDTGSQLYVEETRPRQVRLVDEDNLEEFVFYPQGKSIVVEIPLTIRQGTISRQIREILAVHHAGRGLDVMAHSTAQWPLHTKRYDLNTLEREYWTLLYRMLYPDIAAWRVGDRLKLAPGLNLRDVDRWKFNRVTSPLHRMSSTVGRYLYKAQWTLLNAEQGSFPNASKAAPVEKPFGSRLHSEFLEATGRRIDALSTWHVWLHKEFHEDLVNRVRRKNNLMGVAAINANTQERLPKFISGESDLLS
jgi:hypothetical protein